MAKKRQESDETDGHHVDDLSSQPAQTRESLIGTARDLTAAAMKLLNKAQHDVYSVSVRNAEMRAGEVIRYLDYELESVE